MFSLSQMISAIHHWRGQRHDGLPHSYQMVLFWASLRGAVGVARAAGFTGPSKDALRTTVLLVVVLAVNVLGGTTSRMLKAMGTRTGIDDGGGDSSADEEKRAWLRSGSLGRAGARWNSVARLGCGARMSTIRTAGMCCPCPAATARPSLAACGTSLKRGSTRSTSGTSCRCSLMPSRAGRSTTTREPTGGRARKGAGWC